ncbi:MAG: pilus assembly protein PilM [Candidatus Buchananbacteria bacterium]|nr:pilus assembly protein PilM [Candidatus Buchananbacteria bacterium]
MGIFSSKSSYLGIDIGTSSIKVIELSNFKGRPRLVTYGFIEKKPAEIRNLVDDTAGTAAIINEICAKAKTSSKKVIAALPNFSVFTSILNLPNLPKKELASAISWEAKKIIPMPLEDIILDWKIIEEIEESDGSKISDFSQSYGENQANKPMSKIFSKPQKNLRILLTGASKSLVRKYVDIFNVAGLTLLSLETENFALIRSLVGNDKSTIMLVDFGASTSSIAMVEKGIPVLSRSLEMGGTVMTRAISNSLNVNFDRAEQFKQDLSLGSETADNSLPQTVEKAFSPILNEIKYTLNSYQEQNKKKVEKIILTGGSSLLGNLPGYISKVLNINTYIGDPWARIIFPTELKPILDRLGAKFAIAVGLSMRDIE